MQTVQFKSDIISWVRGLNDEKLIQKLHQWAVEQETPIFFTEGIVPPRRKGSLTEGYGFWENDFPFDETNYREQIWQTEKNVW